MILWIIDSEPFPIFACEWSVTNEPVYLWNSPNRYSIPQLSQSLVAPIPTFLENVAGIKFRISVYLQKKTTKKTIQFISLKNLSQSFFIYLLYVILHLHVIVNTCDLQGLTCSGLLGRLSIIFGSWLQAFLPIYP